MHRQRTRPVVTGSAGDPCTRCDARRLSVCAAVDDADLERLATVAQPCGFRKGHALVREGEAARDFFNVVSGTVKLFKLLPDGRRQVTGFVGAGHFLGLAVRDTYAFGAEAIEPVRACRFSRDRLYRLLDDVPALERRLLETACRELAVAQEQMLLLGRKTARERVASFILAWEDRSPDCCRTGALRLPMTRTEIADYLGLTIETVSRTMSVLRKERRIALPTTHAVEVLDRPALERAAGVRAEMSRKR